MRLLVGVPPARPRAQALDVLGGHIEKMRGDRGFASGEQKPGPSDVRLNSVSVSGGIFLYCPADHLGLGSLAFSLTCG